MIRVLVLVLLMALPVRAEEIVSGLSQSRVSIDARFDGTSILWGSGRTWNLFMAGSSVMASTCTAMASALGPNAWVDLVDYAGGMGCENID